MATTHETKTGKTETAPSTKRGGKRGPRNPSSTVTTNLDIAKARLTTAAKALFDLNKMDRVGDLQALVSKIDEFKNSLA